MIKTILGLITPHSFQAFRGSLPRFTFTQAKDAAILYNGSSMILSSCPRQRRFENTGRSLMPSQYILSRPVKMSRKIAKTCLPVYNLPAFADLSRRSFNAGEFSRRSPPFMKLRRVNFGEAGFAWQWVLTFAEVESFGSTGYPRGAPHVLLEKQGQREKSEKR